nr:MAG TPA: hypothetical protein [Caudoviricetes sp.]DAR26601.1 MAG TPA: hypothetical protein [Caudoviricetes sp.]
MGSRLIFFARVGILECIEDPTLKGTPMLYIILSAITLASVVYGVYYRLENRRLAKQLKYVTMLGTSLEEMYSAYYYAAKEHMDPIEFEKLYEKLCSH